MYPAGLRRCGAVLLTAGVIGFAATISGSLGSAAYLATGPAVAIAGGVALLSGRPRAAAWVRAGALFLLAAAIASLVMGPFLQPLDLTLTEIRLDLVWAAAIGGLIACVLAILLYVVWELGRAPVRDAVLQSGARRFDTKLPAEVGAGVVLLAALLLWFTLHGKSAGLAEQLAARQLGSDYRYHLSWISSAGNGHGTTVSATVIAWNAKEIKKVLIRWETS